MDGNCYQSTFMFANETHAYPHPPRPLVPWQPGEEFSLSETVTRILQSGPLHPPQPKNDKGHEKRFPYKKKIFKCKKNMNNVIESISVCGAVPSGAPSGLRCGSTTATSLMVAWEPPAPRTLHGVLTGYTVEYRPLTDTGQPLLCTTVLVHLSFLLVLSFFRFCFPYCHFLRSFCSGVLYLSFFLLFKCTEPCFLSSPQVYCSFIRKLFLGSTPMCCYFFHSS